MAAVAVTSINLERSGGKGREKFATITRRGKASGREMEQHRSRSDVMDPSGSAAAAAVRPCSQVSVPVRRLEGEGRVGPARHREGGGRNEGKGRSWTCWAGAARVRFLIFFFLKKIN